MKASHLPALLLFAAVSWRAFGQAYTSKGVVRYTKALEVAKLDPSLSHQLLDEWLRSGPPRLDTVQWAVSDCDLKPPEDQPYLDGPLGDQVLFHFDAGNGAKDDAFAGSGRVTIGYRASVSQNVTGAS